MNDVLKFLQDSGVFYLATVENDQPRVRPFGAVCEFEGRIYICTNNAKPVYQQMIANPKVEISSMTPDGRWIRIEAEAVRDDRFDARHAMLEANPNLRGMYNENDGVYEVLYLKNGKATICSFTEAPVSCTF